MDIEKIFHSIDEWYKPLPSYHGNKKIFYYVSYMNSALDEIKAFILKHRDQNIVSTMEDFRSLMDDYACEARTPSQNFIFSIYYDVATNILDMVLEMN